MDIRQQIVDLFYSSNVRKDCFTPEPESYEIYCSIVDVIRELLGTDQNTAKNYYHVLKHRLGKNRETVTANFKKVKFLAEDGKYRYTDGAKLEDMFQFVLFMLPMIEKQRKRLQVRKDDEVRHFHPKVIAFFKEQGWSVHHHVTLPSGNMIDIVASREDKTYLIECKPQLTRERLYSAIGQVLCYRAEYGSANLGIACHMVNIEEKYLRMYFDKLDIELFCL